jgi:outer membrane receptor for ferrienterochelin and colicin
MYRWINRDYTFRPSFDYNETTIKLTSNTGYTLAPLNYTFNDIKLGLKYKKKSLKLSGYYMFSSREDDYLGYGNSLFHKIELRGDYKFNQKYSIYLKTAMGKRTYDVALAYDEIGQAAKYYDSYLAHLGLHYKVNKNLKILGNINFNNQLSSDKRYEYDHLMSSVSLKYSY